MTAPFDGFDQTLVDFPAERVMRITLNRPEKRNALNNRLRTELFTALEHADRNDDVGVTIVRGAGTNFSAGYDLSGEHAEQLPYFTSGGMGSWPRHVTEGCFRIWDLAKPVIAQVHGYCLAGGTELATSCDLVYVAEDAKVGYPVVRSISPPDNQFFPWIVGMRRAMEMMLSGDAITGEQAVTYGFANRAFPAAELDAAVLEIAARIARVPSDLQQMNKRAVHRQMDAMGMRAGIRAGTEMQMLATLTQSSRRHLEDIRKGLTQALTRRDEQFGGYRTTKRD